MYQYEAYIIMSEDGVFLDVVYELNELKEWFNYNKMFDKVYVYNINNYELKAIFWDILER